ncbi:MAG: hypothetical protein QM598_03195 [Protaetiibacter sp.]
MGRGWRGGPAALGALCLVLAPTLAGCAATPAPPDGVTVSLVQQRSDVADRMAEVRVHNGSDAAFAFEGVRVEDTRFATSADIEGEVRLAAGETVDLRFALPDVVCAPGMQLRRTLVFELAGGGELASDLTTADDFTLGLHERECLLAEVSRTAELAWTAFAPSPPGEPAHATLTVTPTGDGDPVLLAGIQSTNLLQFAPKGGDRWGLDLALDAASAAVEVDVPLVPQRCDPHVVQEDKRGTIFTIEVEEPRAGTVELPMPPELKARVLSWVAEWCRFGR